MDSVTILDVGHGNCAVVQTTENVAVIDTGPGTALLEFIEQQKIQHVDLVVLSHSDADHIAGFLQLLAAEVVTIGHVRLNSDRLKKSKLWAALAYEIQEAADNGDLDFRCELARRSGESFNVGDMRLEVLAPGRALSMLGPGSIDRRGRRITSNSISAVLRLVHPSGPVCVFAGDMDSVTLEDMQSDMDVEPEAPILVFPHHGGRAHGMDSCLFAQQLSAWVKPRHVVFSTGRGRFNNPRPEVVLGVRRGSPNCTIACTQMSQTCSPNSIRSDFAHLVALPAVGKISGSCCAGTLRIVVADEQGPVLMPSPEAHLVFIDEVVPSPLCRRSLQ